MAQLEKAGKDEVGEPKLKRACTASTGGAAEKAGSPAAGGGVKASCHATLAIWATAAHPKWRQSRAQQKLLAQRDRPCPRRPWLERQRQQPRQRLRKVVKLLQ
jgi:hypothetical protein